MSGINRIVVDYGDYEGLVLLTSYDYMGNELPYNELLGLDGFDIVKRQIKSLKNILVFLKPKRKPNI